MKQLIRLSIASGYRNNGFKALLVLLLVCLAMAWLASGFSARNPSTLLLDMGFSLLRAALTLLAILWVQELYYKDIERKAVIWLLAYPISRANYLLARYISVALLLSIAIVVSALFLVAVFFISDVSYEQTISVNLGLGYWLTWFYIFLDIMLVVAFTFMLCSYAETPNLPILCAIGFAIGMHGMGAVVDYMRFSMDETETYTSFLLPVAEQFLLLLPDLDRLDLRAWTLYGDMPSVDLLLGGLLMSVAYTLIFMVVSIVGLNKREVS